METLERAAKNELKGDLPDDVHLVGKIFNHGCYQLLDQWRDYYRTISPLKRRHPVSLLSAVV